MTQRRFTFCGSSGREVELETFIDSHVRPEKVQQVLIICHGHERRGLEAIEQTLEALASHRRQSREIPNILVVAPQFYNGLDKDLFGWSGKGSTGNLLVWKGNGWGEGLACQYPSHCPIISSFEALDALVAHYSQKSLFPNLQKMMLVGHSMGGQLVQRYSVLGRAPTELSISFVLMNSSTYLFLETDTNSRQPHLQYKYGLGGVSKQLPFYPPAHLSRSELISRLGSRTVHCLVGLKDRGIGDERPEAMMQGSNRLERTKNWQSHIDSLNEPLHITFDFVPGIGHDARAMLSSYEFYSRLRQ